MGDQLVEVEGIDHVSYQTLRRVLKNDLKRWLNQQWGIPSQANAAFVWRIEDLSDV